MSTDRGVIQPLQALRSAHRFRLTCGGTCFHARVAGREDAPAIVLVHGAGVSSRYMTPLMAALAPGFRVYAPDLPGAGRSTKPPAALDPDELAEALVAWMDAAGIEHAVLVANSVGCQVAVAAALRHPTRVERLVLVGPTCDPGAPTLVGQGLRWLRAGLHEPLSLLLVLLLEYWDFGFVRFVATMRRALHDPFQRKLAEVPVPALVVRGARDRIVSQAWVERVAALLPRGELAVVAEGAHAVNWDAPLPLAALVRRFVGH